MTERAILRSSNQRAKLMRRDTAEILTRLFFVERSLIVGQAGWIPAVPRLEHKAALARCLWEDSLAADGLRRRIFELRYPRRDINLTLHTTPVAYYEEARHAPGAAAYVLALATVLKPALRDAYRAFFEQSDRLSDGPSALVLRHALNDLEAQIVELSATAEEMLNDEPGERIAAEAWAQAAAVQLHALGDSLLEMTIEASRPSALPGRVPFALTTVPARDKRFRRMRVYWPHLVDPDYPSGDGVALQLRSAIGHFNETWAAEAAAVALVQFSDVLDWEFMLDTARWCYDESRHALMGYQRLLDWGYSPEELPVGDYIYRVMMENDPIFSIGLLHYFETRYIHRGQERIATFTEYEDMASRHDYEFDWADETFHAEYGRTWLTELFKTRQTAPRTVDELRVACEDAVADILTTITPEEKREVVDVAAAMFEKAEGSLASASSAD
jgi:hypothetical protein